MPLRPARPEFIAANIPQELRDAPKWVAWRFEWRERQEKWTKVPLNPHAGCKDEAKSTDPGTWAGFHSAAHAANAAVKAGELVDGLGFVFDGDGVFGLDLDHCRDIESGLLTDAAREVLSHFPTYAEVSPSGTGVKLIGRGSLPGTGRKNTAAGLEVYDRGRYFTVTGQKLADMPATVEDCSAGLEWLYPLYFPEPTRPGATSAGPDAVLTDADVLDMLLSKASNADQIRRLWNGAKTHASDSEADLALISHIAFYVGRDAARIDVLFRQSGRMRKKWERADYRATTIAKALGGMTRFYDPAGGSTHLPTPGEGGTAATPAAAAFPLTDLGNARRMLSSFGADIRFSVVDGKWRTFTGGAWVLDLDGAVERCSKATVNLVVQEAISLEDQRERMRLLEHATRMQSARSIKAIALLAQTEEAVSIVADIWDSEPWLLNCPNGVVCLRNGEMLPHRREYFLTQMTPYKYDPAAKCPKWEKFLALIFPKDPSNPELGGDEELIGFMQRLMGLCATGVVEAVMPIFWGAGANGKSTLLNTAMAVLGRDFAMQAPHEFLVEKPNDSHPTDKADLYRRRMVVTSEPRNNRRLDAGLVKALTGGERIRARKIGKDFFEFSPTHTLIMCTNHCPRVPDSDDGIWRRVLLIPFKAKFWKPEMGEIGHEAYRVVAGFESILREDTAEMEGILAWIVRGAMALSSNGLSPPALVRESTNEYRAGENVVGRFLEECCDRSNANGSILLKEVHQEYMKWAEENGEKAMVPRLFAVEIRNSGVVTRVGGKNKTYCHGLRLVTSRAAESLSDFDDG